MRDQLELALAFEHRPFRARWRKVELQRGKFTHPAPAVAANADADLVPLPFHYQREGPIRGLLFVLEQDAKRPRQADLEHAVVIEQWRTGRTGPHGHAQYAGQQPCPFRPVHHVRPRSESRSLAEQVHDDIIHVSPKESS